MIEFLQRRHAKSYISIFTYIIFAALVGMAVVGIIHFFRI